MRIGIFLLALFLSTNLLSLTFEHNGLKRTYLVHVPKCYNKNIPTPLVIALHGGGGSAKKMKAFTKFDEISEKENFIVLFPQGYKRQWNDGRNAESIPAQQLNIDDVGFISALTDFICSQYTIDKSRIYASGPSNGGFMTTRLGCELNNKLAAIAPVISTFPEQLLEKCTPENPLPVMLINGSNDPLVPYNGGDVKVGKKTRGKILSTHETVMFWVKHNKCNQTPKKVEFEDKDKGDSATAVLEIYSGTEENSVVILISVNGGGHTVPGGKQYLPRGIVGIVCRDFVAEEIIWDFFKKQKKNYQYSPSNFCFLLILIKFFSSLFLA
jgi:polyhydroxybutyrate depolymerase